MSYEVSRSMMDYFVPATMIDTDTDEGARYLRWCHKNRDLVQRVIDVLALDANALGYDPHDETRGVALTWTSVPTIASRIRRSDRQTQRILHRMAAAHDIAIHACDGMHCRPFHVGTGAKTNHIYLFQPRADPSAWGAPDSRLVRRARRAATPKPKPEKKNNTHNTHNNTRGR